MLLQLGTSTIGETDQAVLGLSGDTRRMQRLHRRMMDGPLLASAGGSPSLTLHSTSVSPHSTVIRAQGPETTANVKSNANPIGNTNEKTRCEANKRDGGEAAPKGSGSTEGPWGKQSNPSRGANVLIPRSRRSKGRGGRSSGGGGTGPARGRGGNAAREGSSSKGRRGYTTVAAGRGRSHQSGAAGFNDGKKVSSNKRQGSTPDLKSNHSGYGGASRSKPSDASAGSNLLGEGNGPLDKALAMFPLEQRFFCLFAWHCDSHILSTLVLSELTAIITRLHDRWSALTVEDSGGKFRGTLEAADGDVLRDVEGSSEDEAVLSGGPRQYTLAVTQLKVYFSF